MKQENKVFTKLFISTAIPVALQNLLQNSLSFIDTMMISRLGENAIAAVGIGAQIFFLISVILFGVASGCEIFMSQFWGVKDRKGINKTTGLGITVGVLCSSVLALISVLHPQFIMGFFVDEGIVFDLGCTYLRWTGLSFICTAVNMVLNSLMRSVGNAKTPMQITFVSMISDIVLNYILIFKVGLGVKGAAVATVFSRLLESVLLIICVSTKCPVKIRFDQAFAPDHQFNKRVLKTSLPVLIDDGFWALGITVYKVIHAHMGVDVLASVNVMGTIQDLFFVVQNGVGAAAAVLIGNEIGRGNKERSFEISKLSMLYAIITGFATTLLMAGTSRFVPTLFNLKTDVYSLTVKSMLVLSILMPLKFLNHMSIVGLLRSGGDTYFILFVELFSIWCIGVPFTYFAGLVWKFPIYFVYLFTNIEELVKLLISLPRFFSKKWIHVLSNA